MKHSIDVEHSIEIAQSIEVVIPVHDTARPVARALRSVLAQRAELAALGVTLTATVVCHNIAPEAIRASLPEALAGDDGVAWLGHEDGIKSPAGPRNAALAHSAADFLCFLDSDDYLEPGSLAAWWRTADTLTASAVIAPLRTPEGSILPAPRIRPSKPALLDPVRDGLAYRSVPYGLLRRSSLLATGFRYSEGITTGEDLEPTLKLWFRSGAVAYPYGAPAYRQTDDSGAGRVTSSILPLAREFAWLDGLLAAPWLLAATLPERRAVALKLLRVHGIGALVRRATAVPTDPTPTDSTPPLWDEGERQAWTRVYERLMNLSDGALPALNRRDAALAREAAVASSERELRAAVEHHKNAGKAGELLACRPLGNFARGSVLRHYAAERLRARTGVFAAPPAAAPPTE